ncbi:MAG: 23S rRNA (guanosine(2251)-2'-O)-methyltransferase RlmB [Gammaproteobacteria bacterium]|nr:23S rRNA (guanosine(2251)-2'-O)-methyltransferase RlmB [Gammaproteobacteria bacterium]
MAENFVGGFHAVGALLQRPQTQIYELLLADSRNDVRVRKLLEQAQAAGVPLRRVPRAELDRLAPELRHQGALARIETAELVGEALLELPATADRLWLALDGVQDPHNLGACLRSAEAAGASGVLVPKDRAAPLSAVARKAAAGAAERIPLVAVTNLARSLQRLRELGYWVMGLAADGQRQLYEADLSGPLVLVLGGEGGGLRRLTREHCDALLRIPMAGDAESLNVSAATAVCLFEALRQRCVPQSF